MSGLENRRRVVIEAVQPQVDGGRFAVKRTVGDRLVVTADVFADGHDSVACALLWRREDEEDWNEVPMEPVGDDRWRAAFVVDGVGRYRYTVEGWIDRFGSWVRDLEKRMRAGQQTNVDLQIGASLVEDAAGRAAGPDRADLMKAARVLREGTVEATRTAFSRELAALMARHDPRRIVTRYERELQVVVDRQRAGFSAWYELFPRSCATEPGRHGTFRDVERLLPYVAGMGFDVLYLPPIHPIGRTHRKGKNNSPVAGPDDPGSPWAIGGPEGGHKAVHPQLGTLDDFRRLVRAAREYGLEIALDLAFQCSPDHPYVREHPEWFRLRPDGTIQYAENPPKKYQDIYPFDFECEAWESLWAELRDVVRFWIAQGVEIFRVDNPHTKPFAFWEWLIEDIRRDHPNVIFLSEAFTRPKVMYRLAKVGFTQSYTYFAWRNTRWELEQYFTELTQTPVRDFFRANLWPNTPDILPEYLQLGGRPAFAARLVLAATLGANYGIYGPAFELCEATPREPGSEEYHNSEKYEIRCWDRDRPGSLRELVAQVNRIRRENPALQRDDTLRFHATNNDRLIVYSKVTDDRENAILVVVNLDPHHTQSGWTDLALEALGLEDGQPYQVHDLLGGGRYLWEGPRNYVELDPRVLPAHVFRVRRRIRREQDFEYFM
ncbi:MAG: alpha-1,4-glucan--maltose-1-phosphate maltosyltransferase [Armatimonadota bacterium]|nr:alpha-1,4-glucan--maltose-1-phosphate maltosyltransferase [Armatimonadota bacterium]